MSRSSALAAWAAHPRPLREPAHRSFPALRACVAAVDLGRPLSSLMTSWTTAYDLRTGARAAGIAVIALAVATIVTAATDEGGPWSLRLGMLAALSPLAGLLGTLGAMRVAAGRGELRALSAIGVDPWRAMAGAMAGGAVVGLVGPAGAALGIGDLAALFPRPAAARHWVVDGDGLRELTLGIRVGAHGILSLETPLPSAGSGLPPSAPALAIGALAVAAVVGPAWVVAAGGSTRWRAVAGVVAVVAALASFQAVAAGRLSPVTLLTAPLVLLIDAAAARYRARAR
ncbi:Hypothetical protein A7982_03687 [Minicystis rosea]|nr:Hypothetical protein A7982_03687 [Minicystis rosea]